MKITMAGNLLSGWLQAFVPSRFKMLFIRISNLEKSGTEKKGKVVKSSPLAARDLRKPAFFWSFKGSPQVESLLAAWHLQICAGKPLGTWGTNKKCAIRVRSSELLHSAVYGYGYQLIYDGIGYHRMYVC